MRRLVAIVTAVSFGLAAPAFAQTSSGTGAPQLPSQNIQQPSQNDQQPLLLDGQDAMAQQDPNNPFSGNGLLVALGVAGTIGGIVWAISASRKHSVSP